MARPTAPLALFIACAFTHLFATEGTTTPSLPTGAGAQGDTCCAVCSDPIHTCHDSVNDPGANSPICLGSICNSPLICVPTSSGTTCQPNTPANLKVAIATFEQDLLSCSWDFAHNMWGCTSPPCKSSSSPSPSPPPSPSPTSSPSNIHGDPVMSGFDGRPFMFEGEPGAHVNILSEFQHQVTGYLSNAVMAVKNGTYFTAAALKYTASGQELRVKVETDIDGILEVEVNDKPLEMSAGQNSLVKVYGAGNSTVRLNVQKYRPAYGYTLEVETPLIRMTIWSAPPGPDAQGVLQRAYINFETALMEAPVGEMDGVIGRTYAKMPWPKHQTASAAIMPFPGVESEYQVSGLFEDDFPHNAYGLESVAIAPVNTGSSRRRLIERPAVAFPLRASAVWRR